MEKSHDTPHDTIRAQEGTIINLKRRLKRQKMVDGWINVLQLLLVILLFYNQCQTSALINQKSNVIDQQDKVIRQQGNVIDRQDKVIMKLLDKLKQCEQAPK